MRGMNHVYLLGAVAHAPELRYSPNGTAILEITVAGIDTVVGSDNRARDLSWYHRVTLLGEQAEKQAEAYLPGDALLVTGGLEYRTWEKDGARQSRVEVKALRLEKAESGARGEDATAPDARGGQRLKNAINEAMLVGNLTRDPELRYTPGGDAVLGVGLAVNESWKDKSGNWQEKVHFIDVTLWRDLAEAVAELKKGDPLLVVGRVVNESWTDKEGNKRSSTKVEARRAEALVRPVPAEREAAAAAAPARGGGARPASAAARSAATATATRPAKAAPARAGAARKGKEPDIDEGLEEFPPNDDLDF